MLSLESNFIIDKNYLKKEYFSWENDGESGEYGF